LRFRSFPASPQIREYFESLHEEHRHASQPHAQPMARALLHALLVTILRDHDRQSRAAERSPMTTWRVRRTQEAVEKRLHVPELRMENLAAEVGLSSAGLRARFKAETGFTLHEYVLHHRVEEARLRLAQTEEEITAIAHDLGFSSSQYFATVFRRQIGLTPGEYRRKHRQAST
jgi:AraC-like DNA-binding protein